MSATRSRLTLDEPSFERLLAAAFTIQEHNDKEKRTLGGTPVTELAPAVKQILETRCPHCAASLKDGDTVCPQCGSDRFRPGERMQRKFASLWEMSQNQGVRNDPPAPTDSVPELPPHADQTEAPLESEIRIIEAQADSPSQEVSAPEELDWFSRFPELRDLEQGPTEPSSVGGRMTAALRARWQSLNLPRADLYLGIAILVAILALLWPTPVTTQRAHLRPWQRILVTMGIAEAPAPAARYRGNPNVQVWVDPHTALYYCSGEEQFGKTVNGRFTDQREAQLEQFEPAGRSVCP